MPGLAAARPLVEILEKGEDEAFARWLVGFIDGEGCFDIHRQTRPSRTPGLAPYVYFYCRFSMIQRGDDEAIIVECQRRYGGKIYYTPRSGSTNPKVRWELVSKADCRRLAEIIDRYPLRTKKARDYAVWREALTEREMFSGTVRVDVMQPLWERLRALRPYAEAPR